jgi:hypothetical protein
MQKWLEKQGGYNTLKQILACYHNVILFSVSQNLYSVEFVLVINQVTIQGAERASYSQYSQV